MINFRVSARGYTDLQGKILGELKSNNARKEMAQIIFDTSQKYVPKEHGGLRASGYVKPSEIGWSAPYAHYQYEGEIYEVNNPIWRYDKDTKDSSIVGWRSPKGIGTKVPFGRELGAPGYWKGWRFGYSSPGTGHHWFRTAWEREGRSINLKITALLKKLLRNRRKS